MQILRPVTHITCIQTSSRRRSDIMENSDWESVLQFVSEPMDLSDFNSGSEKPVYEQAQRLKLSMPSPQIPTPPVRICLLHITIIYPLTSSPQSSHLGTPVDDEDDDASTLVSVSTTFYPGASHNTQPADLVLMSKDSVFFYVHTNRLLHASQNGFNHMILPSSKQVTDQQLGPIVPVPESSVVLNLILHAIYDMSCAHYAPSFSALETAVNGLRVYGVSLYDHLARGSHLYTLLLSHAPLYPLDLYALAASYDLHDLAVATSSHLLSFSLSSLTDEMAMRIGPVYVKRLFFLHFGRADALKRLLLNPPHPHAPTAWCDFTEQKKLTRAWALASAYLAWDARPGLFVFNFVEHGYVSR